MAAVALDNTMMPADATDSPIWKYLQKRGKVDINNGCSDNATPLNIYYEIYGSGTERVVFVGGMRGNCQMWEANVERFMKLGNYECLVYDHRGTGHSDTGGGLLSLTTSALATDLKKLMLTLKWYKANIVSVSLGGMIALEFACSNSRMIKTLTLGATTAVYTPPLTSIVDGIRILCSQDKKTQLTKICLANYTQDHLASPAPDGSGCPNMLEFYLAAAKRRSKYKPSSLKSTTIGQLLSVFRHRVSASRLSRLGSELPDKHILILTGARDRIINTADSEYLADRIGRQKVIFEQFEEAEHAIHIESCERFVKRIDSMISSSDTRLAQGKLDCCATYQPSYCFPRMCLKYNRSRLCKAYSSHLAFQLFACLLSLGIVLQLSVLLM